MAISIRFDAARNRFFFGDESVTIARLGASLAYALRNGKDVQLHFKTVGYRRHVERMWSEMVKPQYVQQMLTWVAEHGWFWDEAPNDHRPFDSDHPFDPANITPSLSWRLVSEMRLGATQLQSAARRLELESEWHEHRRIRPQMVEQVKALRSQADGVLAQATDLLRLAVPVHS